MRGCLCRPGCCWHVRCSCSRRHHGIARRWSHMYMLCMYMCMYMCMRLCMRLCSMCLCLLHVHLLRRQLAARRLAQREGSCRVAYV